jgi:hypothetical protein
MKTLKGRSIAIGQEVFVYFNLHKKCFSVKDVKTGLVVAHTDGITLEEATFKVSAKGRDRVRATGVKNVHAGVQGKWCGLKLISNPKRAHYDPKTVDTFVNYETHEPLKGAALVRLDSKKVWYSGASH